MSKVWFFDLDGTIADTDSDIRLAWKAAISDLGLECPAFDEKFVAGPPFDEMAKILFPESHTPALTDALRSGFASHYDSDGFPSTREYPGVIDAVKSLKARGDRVFIATNKRFAGATAMARHFGWDGIFDGLYAGDMHKDDPIGKLAKGRLIALAMREIGASREDCTLVGDTHSDFEAARENGIASIAVSWGYGKSEELALADVVISSADELL
jgi:phosphoglycolate phosphatase